MSDDKYDALAQHLGAAVAVAVAGEQKGKTVAKNPDYQVMELAWDVVDRVKTRGGMAASIEAARAMLQTGLDLEAGRCVVEKDGASVRVRYKANDLYSRAVAAAGQQAVDQVLTALREQAQPARATTKLTDAQKGYDVTVDPLAAAFHADQLKGKKR